MNETFAPRNKKKVDKFNSEMHARAVYEYAVYEIGKMTCHLHNFVTGNGTGVIYDILMALCEIRYNSNLLLTLDHTGLILLQANDWDASSIKCEISIRRLEPPESNVPSHVIVAAKYVDGLFISLPIPDLWPDCGLSWLYGFINDVRFETLANKPWLVECSGRYPYSKKDSGG